ncbi:MAG: hypothetical protein OCD01_05505 [Fibrobacterales bacterium]
MIEFCTPIFTTSHLETAIDLYKEMFNFVVDSEGEGYAQISRDGVSLMLQETENHSTQQLLFGVSNFRELFKEFNDNGVIFIQLPENSDKGNEFRVKDYDGNILWFVDSNNL